MISLQRELKHFHKQRVTCCHAFVSKTSGYPPPEILNSKDKSWQAGMRYYSKCHKCGLEIPYGHSEKFAFNQNKGRNKIYSFYIWWKYERNMWPKGYKQPKFKFWN